MRLDQWWWGITKIQVSLHEHDPVVKPDAGRK